eukprot:c5331_g1_i1.p1 GENE.c5331_g1_i1~~c5331_g1_i1.p1  ORF type:complete len:343 (+),score=63.03 c5331_g1_i1:51-1079(+)
MVVSGEDVVAALQWGVGCLAPAPPATSELRLAGTLNGRSVWFTVLHPFTFEHIRSTHRIAHADFQNQLTAPFLGGKKASTSKSGSIFYRTQNGEYMVKGISKEEAVCLGRMISDYNNHISSNPISLLSRVVAAYRVRIGDGCSGTGVKRYFAVLLNVFHPNLQPFITQIYDLKGTTENRLVKPEVMAQTKIGKDLNFKETIPLPADITARIHTALEADCTFLESKNILDYSLLIGIASIPSSEPAPADWLQGANGLFYRLAIIDMLQPYTARKQAAHIFKSFTMKLCYHIDTEPPPYYAKRFLRYCKSKIVSAAASRAHSSDRTNAVAESKAEAEKGLVSAQ